MIVFKISDRSTPPPGGWYWVEPTTQRIFKHYARDAFFEQIRDHRLAQGIPIEPGWQEVIEDQMCREHPEWGREVCLRTERYGERRPFSLAAMQSFINVMVSWIGGMLMGREVFVPQKEAERRAAICMTCEFNAPLPGSCGACAQKIAQALTIIGSRKTEFDDSLGACALCSCALKVAVHMPLEAQQAGLSEDLKDEFRRVKYCWKNEGL